MNFGLRLALGVAVGALFVAGAARGQSDAGAPVAPKAAVVVPTAAAVFKPMVIDATAAEVAPGPADYSFVAAEAKSPDGHALGLNSLYLTRDGKPWLPVMGEMHYSRVPEAEWEDEILKMKSAGVEIVAAYIIWIHHEEIEGEWDWAGNKDLRKFVQLCQKHGMYVVPRIGPWSHAEVRNGGFPDWLLKKTAQQRSNDPEYLKYVDTYYKQIGEQLKGLMWDQGGPVIAVQLENEYRGHGPLGGTAHILKLKEIARDAGLKVPFYTLTGWDGAAIPKGAVLPVYGGYPDAPWDASIEKLPASEVYAFRFGSRVTGDMGAIGASGQAPTGNAANFTRDTPFMTAEMGGGMQVTYHRRPVVSSDDVAAMMPAMLGSGVNLYGTYMFQGGENPDGKLTTLQESLATKYANDLPVKTYDFEAPLGEFGDERESLRKLKSWNYFLNDFGEQLAPMEVRRPEVTPSGPKDLSVVRVSARTSGQSGFLFVNNHVRGYQMPGKPDFQVEMKLPEGKTLLIPEKTVPLQADSYFCWPFNLDLDGLKLRFAIAQPLAKLGTKEAPVYAFFAQPGMPAEFVVEDAAGLTVDRTRGVERHDGAVWLHGLSASPTEKIKFTMADGRTVTLLLLRQVDAEVSWKIRSGGLTDLLMTTDEAFVDGDTATLESLGSPNLSARLLVSGGALAATDAAAKLTRDGADWSANVAAPGRGTARLEAKQTKQAGEAAPLPAGFAPSSKPRVVAAAPTHADWTRAAEWTIALPKADAAAPRFLRIQYTGDVARLYAGDHLLTDDFNTGRPWLVGLARFAPQLQGQTLRLAVYPLRKNAPIFFEPGLAPDVEGPQAVGLQAVELVTEYSVKMKMEAKP